MFAGGYRAHQRGGPGGAGQCARPAGAGGGKLLGYIPRAALDEFEAFNPKNLPCPFTGRITVDTSNHLYGTLHITQPRF